MADQGVPANTERQYRVTPRELPASCPMPGMALWNAHPKVFLAFTDNKAVCPYCDAVFLLVPQTQESSASE
jgi:uncharacterized Zn-finger protein